MIRRLSLAIAAAITLGSCQSTTTAPQPAGFQFQVTVVDTMGVPVPQLMVSAWNLLTTPYPAKPTLNLTEAPGTVPCPIAYGLNPVYPNPFTDSASVLLDLPESAHYRFVVRDLSGREVAVVEDSLLGCGSMRAKFGSTEPFATAYRLTVTTHNMSGIRTYSDECYMAFWTTDAVANSLGFTGSDGSLLSTDASRFPSLFQVPEMELRDAFGQFLNNFRYADSIRIVLTDTTTTQTQAYAARIQSAANAYRLTWNP